MPAIFFAILTVLTTAAFNLALREAMQVWPVSLAGLGSRCITLPLLAAWILTRRGGWRRLRPGSMLPHLLVMAVLSVAVNLLWFSSLKFTTATNAAMLMCLDLVFVVLIGGVLGLERIRRGEIALLPVLLCGMALLVGVADGRMGGHWLGDLMAVTVALAYAANAFIIRRILRVMDEEAVALYNHGLSTLGFIVLLLLGDAAGTDLAARATLAAWTPIVVLGVIAAVSLPIYYAALHRLQVWRLRAWLLLAPVLVALVEWILGVRLTQSQWLGAAIVLGGLGLMIRMELCAKAAAAARGAETPVVARECPVISR